MRLSSKPQLGQRVEVKGVPGIGTIEEVNDIGVITKVRYKDEVIDTSDRIVELVIKLIDIWHLLKSWFL